MYCSSKIILVAQNGSLRTSNTMEDDIINNYVKIKISEGYCMGSGIYGIIKRLQ